MLITGRRLYHYDVGQGWTSTPSFSGMPLGDLVFVRCYAPVEAPSDTMPRGPGPPGWSRQPLLDRAENATGEVGVVSPCTLGSSGAIIRGHWFDPVIHKLAGSNTQGGQRIR